MLGDEFVEGTILIKRSDHVIAIAPGPGTLGIGLHTAIGISIAGHIEPVTPPALPIGRRFEKPIHQPFVTGIGGIFEEGGYFFRRRRKPGQVKGHPADPLLGSRRLGQPETFLLQASQQIGVDGCSNSFGRSDLRWLGMPHRLERPEPALFFGDDPTRHLQRFGTHGRSSLRNPPLDEHDLLRQQWLTTLGHLAGFQYRQKMALSGLAWHENHSGFGTIEQQSPLPQIHPTLGFVLLAMALKTMGFENRSDIALKNRPLRRFWMARCGGRSRHGPKTDSNQQA